MLLRKQLALIFIAFVVVAIGLGQLSQYMNLRMKMAIMLIVPILSLIFFAQKEIRRSMKMSLLSIINI
ncbi:MAG: hypothetical protein GY941_12020 [Planctomycetes bacterium]|nr:hypothetical protein [Planctomycetota bacterium]